ncbi:NAD(P)/FAD-dependent oxidoreductase [candidate division WOR-3 bacterium]|nr:NAD(P)/FAD-dependent oxidoreductase [candidate division WOR-3 bacterium]
MEDTKSIIIIGGGIAGLSAGCYARMNGYETIIFEMHDKPGGLCAAWKRKGYTFDGCVHWLMGATEKSPFHEFWQELGAIQGRKMFNYDELLRYESAEGKQFILYTDIARLERHMLEIAPEDAKLIKDFIKATRSCLGLQMPADKPPELYTTADGFKLMFKMLPKMSFMKKWSAMSFAEFASRFRNPFMREAINNIWYPEMPVFSLLFTMASLYDKSSAYPIGGSLPFARAIEKRYLDLGGKIEYKKKVSKIIIEDNTAKGVVLEDSSEHRADFVISAADGHATIFDMLEGRYVDDKIRSYYDTWPLFPPSIQVSFGVSKTFDDAPHWVNAALKEPMMIGGKEQKIMTFFFYNFDPTLAPEGKTAVVAFFPSDYDYWVELYKNPKRYKTEKEKVADQIVKILDARFPGAAAKIRVRDIATPVTYNRYTGNWQGSYEGWLPTTVNFHARISKTLPGLENFWMIGQWIQPGGGLPTGAMTGRHVIQIICHQDGKEFRTSRPG